MKKRNNKLTIFYAAMVAVTVILLLLKTKGILDIGYLWVFAPVWIPTALIALVLVAVLIVAVVDIMHGQVYLRQKEAELKEYATSHGVEYIPGESTCELKQRIAIHKQKQRRATKDERHR